MSVQAQQAAAREAVNRLGDIGTLSVQTAALYCAVRALILAHPERDTLRAYYDQLLAQIIASPAVMGDTDRATVLHDLTETLFRPPMAPGALD